MPLDSDEGGGAGFGVPWAAVTNGPAIDCCCCCYTATHNNSVSRTHVVASLALLTTRSAPVYFFYVFVFLFHAMFSPSQAAARRRIRLASSLAASCAADRALRPYPRSAAWPGNPYPQGHPPAGTAQRHSAIASAPRSEGGRQSCFYFRRNYSSR